MIREIDAFLEDGFPYGDLLKLRPDLKNDAKAMVLRNLGNQLYNPTKLDVMSEALLYYNESIAQAAKGSEARAIAYGNRASVCYHFRRYEDCLRNVKLARASNYPDRLAAKLKNREEQTMVAMRKKELCEDECCTSKASEGHVIDELQLCYKANPYVPQMTECLQLRRNARFGRHVVTDRPLKVGDVVMIEQPYVTMVHEELRFLRCGYCYETNPFTLIPCEGCTMEMYCSEACRSKAHQQYHRYECGIVRDLKRISDNVRNGIEGLRVIAKAIVTFGHDLDAFKKHLEKLDESKVNAFTMDWKAATAKDVYNTVHVLSTNETIRDRKEMALQIFHSTIVHRLMLERTELGTLCAANPGRKKILFDLILRHWQICETNRVTMHHMAIIEDPSGMKKYTDCLRTHAYGCFSLISMLNHSCVPNVVQLALNDGRTAVVVIKPVAPGEQLFDSYFSGNALLGSAIVKYYVENYFKFVCRCAACELLPDVDCEVNADDIQFVHKVRQTKPMSKSMEELLAYMNEPGRSYTAHRLTSLQLLLTRYLMAMYCVPPLNILLFNQNTLEKHAP